MKVILGLYNSPISLLIKDKQEFQFLVLVLGILIVVSVKFMLWTLIFGDEIL